MGSWVGKKSADPEGSARRDGWRRPTLPRPLRRSTIGAAGLNCRVRNGTGCGPCALVVSQFLEPGAFSRQRMLTAEAIDPTIGGWSYIDVRNAGEIKLHGRLVRLD